MFGYHTLPLIICLCMTLLGAPRAYADNVSNYCKDDYLTYCSHTEPYSKECRSCMRSNLPRLSLQCKQALKLAGYRR